MNTNLDRYEIRTWWSDEEDCFLAEMPEFPGCMADGPTREVAIQNITVIAQEWIETAQSLGRAVPGPKKRLSFA